LCEHKSVCEQRQQKAHIHPADGKRHASLDLYPVPRGRSVVFGKLMASCVDHEDRVMAYDWTGVQTRKTRRLRIILLSLLSLAALSAPVLGLDLISKF
jgi:hypothetical protein